MVIAILKVNFHVAINRADLAHFDKEHERAAENRPGL